MTDAERKKRLRLLALAEAEAAASPSGNGHPIMSQINTGIAEGVGGMVDLLNPFDKYTGSAVSGLENVMNAAGIETVKGQPETLGQGMLRGAGQAAGSFLPVAGGIGAIAKAGGVTGAVAGDVYNALVPATSRAAMMQAPAITGRAGRIAAAGARSVAPMTGIGADMAAGAIVGGADKAAQNLGAGPTTRAIIDTVAPALLAVPGMAARTALRISPVAAAYRGAKKAIAPFTSSGAREVAGERMVNLAGGQDRASELASKVGGDNPLNLTPAQQTQEPNLLAMERLAGSQDPSLSAELTARKQASSDLAQGEIAGMGSSPDAAQSFFAERRRAFVTDLNARADQAVTDAKDRIAGITGTRPDGVNSQEVFNSVKQSFDTTRMEEKALWDAIPRDVEVGTSNAVATANRWSTELGRAGADDMPKIARQLLIDQGGYKPNETVGEMHRLYSKMREIARNAMAGTNKQATTAKVANDIADAILKDLGAGDFPTGVGRKINEARAFSAAMHETYDQGAPGKILKRTLDGDTTIDPQMSLQTTVGRSGTAGAVASSQIEAAGGQPANITDYIASQFNRRAVSPGTGEVSLANARTFMADNAELMARYPELKAEIQSAVAQGETADALAQRITRRVAAISDAKRSATAKFIGSSGDKAINAVFNVQNPIRAARRIANEARKDPTGKAMDGVKAVFTDYLIGSSSTTKGAATGIDASRLNAALKSPKTRRAMEQIFTSSELSRLRFIAKELAKSQQSAGANIGENLSGAQANRFISIVLRILGAKHGAKLGGSGGGSLQTASIVSSRVKDIANSLTTDRASQMLSDAITDPDLFKALLTQTSIKNADRRVIPYFMPYLVGGASAAMQQ